MFGSVSSIPAKWFITFETFGVMYYLTNADSTLRKLVWTHRQDKALKFDSATDAEKVLAEIKSHRKNKKLVFKVR